jgi:hypothetical protein
MRPRTVDTPSGFTAIVCQACNTNPDLPVLQTLREAIRRCPHGVLVSSSCPLGHLQCHTRNRNPRTAGPVLVVQPCTSTTRQPLGPAIPVGPLRTPEDLTALTHWLEQPPPSRHGLPARLQRLPGQRYDATHN